MEHNGGSQAGVERHLEWRSGATRLGEDCIIVGRGSGLSALYPFAWGEEKPFDIIWVVTLAVERRVNQASEPL